MDEAGPLRIPLRRVPWERAGLPPDLRPIRDLRTKSFEDLRGCRTTGAGSSTPFRGARFLDASVLITTECPFELMFLRSMGRMPTRRIDLDLHVRLGPSCPFETVYGAFEPARVPINLSDRSFQKHELIEDANLTAFGSPRPRLWTWNEGSAPSRCDGARIQNQQGHERSKNAPRELVGTHSCIPCTKMHLCVLTITIQAWKHGRQTGSGRQSFVQPALDLGGSSVPERIDARRRPYPTVAFVVLASTSEQRTPRSVDALEVT